MNDEWDKKKKKRNEHELQLKITKRGKKKAYKSKKKNRTICLTCKIYSAMKENRIAND